MNDLLIDNDSNLVCFISGRLSTYYDFNWSGTYLRKSSPDVFRGSCQSWSVQPVNVSPSRLSAKSAKGTYGSCFSAKGTTDEKFVSLFSFLFSGTRASWLLLTFWNFLFWHVRGSLDKVKSCLVDCSKQLSFWNQYYEISVTKKTSRDNVDLQDWPLAFWKGLILKFNMVDHQDTRSLFFISRGVRWNLAICKKRKAITICGPRFQDVSLRRSGYYGCLLLRW